MTVLHPSGPTICATAEAELAISRKRRHWLVVVLTFVTGSADATGFIALGGAFSSVMTGNMVLLGLSAAHADVALAMTAGAAIVSYAVGVIIGASIAGSVAPDDAIWPRRVTWALVVEICVLLGFAVAWYVTLEGRSWGADIGLLAVAAGALGIQSSAVQRFGVSGLSSTYLTGTLTTVIAAVAIRKPWAAVMPSVQILVALIVGAAVGGLVVAHIPWAAPALLLLPLGYVVAASTALDRVARAK